MAIFLLLFLSFFVLATATATTDPLYQICGQTDYFANHSTYSSNLKLHLSSLSSKASVTELSASKIGTDSGGIYSYKLCRGDLDTPTCRSCIYTAILNIMKLCPDSKEAAIWYDACQFRYSDQDFISNPDIDSNIKVLMYNYQNVTAIKLLKFEAMISVLFRNLSDLAVRNPVLPFATGKTVLTATNLIYGLVQCARDLSTENCQSCLNMSAGMITQIPFKGRVGGRTMGLWCNMRYEFYKFYNNTSILQLPSAPLPPLTPTSQPPLMPPIGSSYGGGSSKMGLVLEITIPGVCVFLIATIFLCFWRRRPKAKKPSGATPEEIINTESILFDLSTLEVATSNFSELNKIGQGGFGSVYKGILPDGRVIAVKRLSIESRQGLKELKNELVLVAKLMHRNLVRLHGVCLEEQEKLLVYEYMPNKSLDTILFDPEKSQVLDWRKRFNIIEGITRGLLYLHEGSRLKIIHRDIKPSNILLDEDMNSKISDFGMARLFGGDETLGMTSHVVGTFGYIAPEYGRQGHFSVKSDVFSFGVLLLEIITGKRNDSFFNTNLSQNLISYVWEKWNNGTILEVVDLAMGEDFPRIEVLRCIQIGILCVQEDPAQRPTMSTVLLMLNSISVSLEAPSLPAFYLGRSGINTAAFTMEFDLNGDANHKILRSMPVSLNEVSVTEMDPR